MNVEHDSIKSLDESAQYTITGGTRGRPANMSSTGFLSSMNQVVTGVIDFYSQPSKLKGIIQDVAIIMLNNLKDPNIYAAVCQPSDSVVVTTANDRIAGVYFNNTFAPGSLVSPASLLWGSAELGYFPRDLAQGQGYTSSYPDFVQTFDRGVSTTGKFEITIPFQQAGNTNLQGMVTLGSVATRPSNSELTKAGLAGFTSRTQGSLARAPMPKPTCGVLIGGTEPDYLTGQHVIKAGTFGTVSKTYTANSVAEYNLLSSINSDGSNCGILLFNQTDFPPRYDDPFDLDIDLVVLLTPDILAVQQSVIKIDAYADYGYVDDDGAFHVETIPIGGSYLTLSRITTGGAVVGNSSLNATVANPQTIAVGGFYYPRFLLGVRACIRNDTGYIVGDVYGGDATMKLYSFNIGYSQPQAIALITDGYTGPVSFTRTQAWQLIPNSTQAPLLANQLSNPCDPMARSIIMQICNKTLGSTQGFVGTQPEFEKFLNVISTYDFSAFRMAHTAPPTGHSLSTVSQGIRDVSPEAALSAAGVYGAAGMYGAAGVYGATGLKDRLKKRRSNFAYSLADAGMDTVEGLAHTPESAMSMYGASAIRPRRRDSCESAPCNIVSSFDADDINPATFGNSRQRKILGATGLGSLDINSHTLAAEGVNNYQRTRDRVHLSTPLVGQYNADLARRNIVMNGKMSASGVALRNDLFEISNDDDIVVQPPVESDNEPHYVDLPSQDMELAEESKGQETQDTQGNTREFQDSDITFGTSRPTDYLEMLETYRSMITAAPGSLPLSILGSATGISYVDPSCANKPNSAIAGYQSNGAMAKGFNTFNVSNGALVDSTTRSVAVCNIIVSNTQLNFSETASFRYQPFKGSYSTVTYVKEGGLEQERVSKVPVILNVSDQWILDGPDGEETRRSFASIVSILVKMRKGGVYYVCVRSETAAVPTKSIEGPSLALAIFLNIIGLPQGPIITGNVDPNGRVLPVGDIDIKLLSLQRKVTEWSQDNMAMFILPSDTELLEEAISRSGPERATQLRTLLGVIQRAESNATLDLLGEKSPTAWLRAVPDVGTAIFQFLGHYFYVQSLKVSVVAMSAKWAQSRFKNMLRWIDMPGAAKGQALEIYGAWSVGNSFDLPSVPYDVATKMINDLASDPSKAAVMNALVVLRDVFGDAKIDISETIDIKKYGELSKNNSKLIDMFSKGFIELKSVRTDQYVTSDTMPGKKKPTDFAGQMERVAIGITGKGSAAVPVYRDLWVMDSGRKREQQPKAKKSKDKSIQPSGSNAPRTSMFSSVGSKRARDDDRG